MNGKPTPIHLGDRLVFIFAIAYLTWHFAHWIAS